MTRFSIVLLSLVCVCIISGCVPKQTEPGPPVSETVSEPRPPVPDTPSRIDNSEGATYSGPEHRPSPGSVILFVQGPHSGELAEYGLPSLQAARYVADQYNGRGGVLGRRVEVRSFDDQCLPDRAEMAGERLRQSGATLVVGPICNGVTEAMLPLYGDLGVVNITPSATDPDLGADGRYPRFFRTIAPDGYQTAMQIRYLIWKGVRRVALLRDGTDYGKEMADRFAQQAEASSGRLEVVIRGRVESAGEAPGFVEDYVLSSGAEYVVFHGYMDVGVPLYYALEPLRGKVGFLAGDTAGGPAGLRQHVPTMPPWAAYTSPHYYSDEFEAVRSDFTRTTGNDPGPFFWEGYTAAELLLQAVERAGTTEADGVARELREGEFTVPGEVFRFDDKGVYPMEKAFGIYRWQHGEETLLFP